MAESFFDKLKSKVGAAGSAAQRLTRVGQLKVELLAAESQLERRYSALGRACANRLLDRSEGGVSPEDPVIAGLLDDTHAARDEVERLKTELGELR
jgi:HAMP domain-containing protein